MMSDDPSLLLSLAHRTYEEYCHKLLSFVTSALAQGRLCIGKRTSELDTLFINDPLYALFKYQTLHVVVAAAGGGHDRIEFTHATKNTADLVDEKVIERVANAAIDVLGSDTLSLRDAIASIFLLSSPFNDSKNETIYWYRIRTALPHLTVYEDAFNSCFKGCIPYLGLTPDSEVLAEGVPKAVLDKYYRAELGALDTFKQYQQAVAARSLKETPLKALDRCYVIHDEHTEPFHKFLYSSDESAPNDALLRALEAQGVHHAFFEGLFLDGQRHKVHFYGLETSQDGKQAKVNAGFWALMANQNNPDAFDVIRSNLNDILCDQLPDRRDRILRLPSHMLGAFISRNQRGSDPTATAQVFSMQLSRYRPSTAGASLVANESFSYWNCQRDFEMKTKVLQVMTAAHPRMTACALVVGALHSRILSGCVDQKNITQIAAFHHSPPCSGAAAALPALDERQFHKLLFQPARYEVFDVTHAQLRKTARKIKEIEYCADFF